MHRREDMNGSSRSAERVIRPCLAGTPPIRSQTSDGYMDSADVCRVLNITKRTLQSYRDKGILPYTRIGGKFFYRERDLVDYLERRTVKKQ